MSLSIFRSELLKSTSADEVMALASRWEARVDADERFEIWNIVAEHAPSLDSRLALEVCRNGVSADKLLLNPAASASTIETAVSFLARDLSSASASQLRTFARKGWLAPDSAIVRQLQQTAQDYPSRVAEVISVLSHIPDVEDSFWERWAEKITSSAVRLELARSRRTPLVLLRSLVVRGEVPRAFYEALASSQEAREDAFIRECLLGAARSGEGGADLLIKMSMDATPAELLDSFTAAINNYGAKEAALVLESAPTDALSVIDRNAVRPLLESADADTRLIAIRTFSTLRGDSPESVSFQRWLRDIEISS